MPVARTFATVTFPGGVIIGRDFTVEVMQLQFTDAVDAVVVAPLLAEARSEATRP